MDVAVARVESQKADTKWATITTKRELTACFCDARMDEESFPRSTALKQRSAQKMSGINKL